MCPAVREGISGRVRPRCSERSPEFRKATPDGVPGFGQGGWLLWHQPTVLRVAGPAPPRERCKKAEPQSALLKVLTVL